MKNVYVFKTILHTLIISFHLFYNKLFAKSRLVKTRLIHSSFTPFVYVYDSELIFLKEIHILKKISKKK